MSNLKKLLTFAICIFISQGVFAETEDNYSPTRCEPEPPCPKACTVPASPTTAAYLQKANIDVCSSWDFYVTGTFLWWQPSQGQMEYAETGFSANLSTLVGKLHKLSRDWKAGFKVGLGLNWNYDGWDSYAQYTRVNSIIRDKANLGTHLNETLSDTWLAQSDPLATTREVTARWKLDFNIFDLEFGRPAYYGTCLTLRPHFGLKGGWIDQEMFIRDQDTNIANLPTEGTFKSDSWLVGLRAGLNSKWEVGSGFRFFGNGSLSLYYQKFRKISVKEESLLSEIFEWHLAQNFKNSYINPALEMKLGLGWGSYFYRNNWHFDLEVGYETQVYFDQNMMRFLQQVSGARLYFSKPGNLMFHGLNVTARFDF